LRCAANLARSYGIVVPEFVCADGAVLDLFCDGEFLVLNFLSGEQLIFGDLIFGHEFNGDLNRNIDVYSLLFGSGLAFSFLDECYVCGEVRGRHFK